MESRRQLPKVKLAGILRQLFSYGILLPDLSPLRNVSSATAVVVLEIGHSKLVIQGKVENKVKLLGVKPITLEDIKRQQEFPYNDYFAFQCYCQPSAGTRGPSYQFWLNAIKPGVKFNGYDQKVGVLFNVMGKSVSLIQTYNETAEFHLFIHLHDVYWPPVDRYIRWADHFVQTGYLETLQILPMLESHQQFMRINGWIDDLISQLEIEKIDDSELYQKDDIQSEGFEDWLAVANPPQLQGNFTRMPTMAEKDAPSSGTTSNERNPVALNLTGIPSGLGDYGGAKAPQGHRRSSRIKENMLLKTTEKK